MNRSVKSSWVTIFLACLMLAACDQAGGLKTLSPVGLSQNQPPAPPADDTIIIYGGIAYVDKRAQPLLDNLLYQGEQPSPVALELNRYIVGKPIAPAVSIHPVVDDPGDFRKLVADKNAVDVNTIRGQALENEVAGAKVLVLSLIGGLEFDFPVPKSTTIGSFVNRVSLVTVTAVLSRPGTGEIVLSSQATTQRILRGGGQDDLAEIYIDAGKNAIDSLKATAARYRPSGKTSMVTGVVMAGANAARAFEFSPNSFGEGDNPCNIELRCPINPQGGETSCRKLQSALANLATEAFAAKGRTMLPPRDFAIWAEINQEESGRNIGVLSFSTVGGWFARDQKVALLIEPDKADEKIVVDLADLNQIDVDSGNQLINRFLFKADFRMLGFSGGSCAASRPTGMLTPFAGTAEFICNYPSSIPRIDGSLARLYLIAALRKGLDLEGRSEQGQCQ